MSTPKKTASREKGTDTHVALLRGINVGGNNKVPMKDLVEMFLVAGCAEATTFIQSGNVIAKASPRVAKNLAGAVEGLLAARLGVKVPVVIRTAEELRAVVGRNPFRKADADHLHVAFLAHEPAKVAVQSLDAKRSPPDEFAVDGREIYLLLPNGVGRSKLTNAYFDSKLATTSTLRNWRTVLKLIELSRGTP